MTAPAAPLDQPWYEFVGVVDQLLEDDDFLFWFDALTGIRDTVLNTQRVNDAQVLAVHRIQAAAAGAGGD